MRCAHPSSLWRKKGWVENYGKLECLDHALGLCRAMFFWRVSTRTVQTGGIEEKWSWNNSSEQIKQGGENNISKLLLAAIQKNLFISSFLISLRSSSRAMENGNVYTMFKSWLNHLSLKSSTNGSFSMAMLNNQGYQGYTVTCCACSSQRRCTASSWQRQLLSPSTCRWVWGSQHDFSADSPPPEIFAARPGLWQVVSTTQHTHTHSADIKKPQPRYNHHVQMHLICFHSSSPARVLFGIRSLLLLFLFLSQFFHCQLIPWCIRLRRIVFRQCLENRPTEQLWLWQPLPTFKGPHWRLMGTYVNSSFGKRQ